MYDRDEDAANTGIEAEEQSGGTENE
jgi:hypothetical protein